MSSRTALGERVLRAIAVAGGICLVSAMISVCSVQSSQAQSSGTISTPKQPSSYDYWYTNVNEDYRWLEDWTDQGVKDWSMAEDAAARRYFNGLPNRGAIISDIRKLYTSGSSQYYYLTAVSGAVFAFKSSPTKEQPTLIVLRSLDDTVSAKVVLDPNTVDPSGLTAIDFYVPSSDGKLVAVSLSKNGSEDGTLYIFDVATGKSLPDVIPGVNYPTGGGSVAWNRDNSGIYYTRYPHPGEREDRDIHFYQQVYFHRLGNDPKSDRYEIGTDFPRIAEVALERSPDGRFVLASVANGDGGEFAHYLKSLADAAGTWKQITRFSDKVSQALFGQDGAVYLLSTNGAPRGKILRVPLTTPTLSKATVVVKQGEAVIESFLPTASDLWIVDMLGGPSRLRRVSLKTLGEEIIPTLSVSSVGTPIRISDGAIAFTQETYIYPTAWYVYEIASGKVVPTALVKQSIAKYGDVEVVREFAVSKDGTKIPMNIIRNKGIKLDGSNPTILNGYGGFGINQSPKFSQYNSIWLNQGGVYVVANLRGGGEYGEEWHEAGRLLKKQNVFDDFIACAEHLIKAGYTSPQKLAIQGGSNGGLLMGAAFTQRPELFRAVVSAAGIYDMLRVELSPNGSFNVTEFGSTRDSAQFKALYAYSPYHHVVDGKAYPAVLFTVGENDGRVDPMQSRKMTARLQAATSSGYPIYLRVNATSGHGQGSSLSETIEEDADTYSFLFDQLGVKYRPIGR